jgi:transcriptional regulator with XRE-family HTH domain
MRERILEFLKSENKSSAQFAEEIGVQPSGISHILSGRNKPSLDFVLKMLEKYKLLSTDWLLFGKGSMYKNGQMKSLFDDGSESNTGSDSKMFENENVKSALGSQNIPEDQKRREPRQSPEDNHRAVEKIVWLYRDKSFEEYFPRYD